MEGIGLNNMLGAEEVNRLFANQAGVAEEAAAEEEEVQASPEKNSETEEETAEVDFSDLLGNNPPESVGSEENTEGNRETPESNSDSGTPQNPFSSIAIALRDEGVFPDLSEDEIKAVIDPATLKELFDNQVAKSLDDRQKMIEKAMNSGATSEELQDYQRAVNDLNYLEKKDTLELLSKEGEDGENLRKQLMYFDYISKGFKHERAVKMVQKSFDEGNDVEDAKEAFESYKDFCEKKVKGYQQELETRKQKKADDEKKQYDSLKKNLLDKESFYEGVKVDKATRQKAYDSITKPVYKDKDGNYLTALQKYQREHPAEFWENVALLYTLTGEFKNVEKLANSKAQKKIKSAFAEVGNLLNNSRRNGDGTLNLANTPPEDREKWDLAI